MFVKRRTTTKSVAVAAVIATAVLAAACGSGSSTTQVEAQPTSSSAPSSSSTSTSGEDSPIADLLGLPITDDDAMEEYFGQLQREAEAKIAECMLAQGFQYKVIDYSGLTGAAISIDEDTAEFAEQYGFGIASNPFEESFESFQDFEDPNEEYLKTLSPGETEAYQEALSGTLPDFSDGDDVEFSFEPSGCQGDAYEEVFSFGLVFEQFSDEFEQIEEAYNSDPRIVNATSGWSSCMAEAGYSYSDEDGARDEIRRRNREITGNEGAFAEITSGEANEQEGEFIFGPRSLTPEAQKQVDALVVEEKAVAVASWDCNAPLRDIEADVRVEYEQKFVDQHGAAISQALNE